jgi:hypothetical protein
VAGRVKASQDEGPNLWQQLLFCQGLACSSKHQPPSLSGQHHHWPEYQMGAGCNDHVLNPVRALGNWHYGCGVKAAELL